MSKDAETDRTDGNQKLCDGKLPPDVLERKILKLRGAHLPEVLAGPGIGEDAALIRWPQDQLLAASSDPIVGAIQGAGKLLVAINANDIACKGGDPRYLIVTLIVPAENGVEKAQSLMSEIDESCRELGIAIVGGHTELTSRYDRPVVVGTMLGPTTYHYTAEAIQSGDCILMTKHAGLEGMSILAHDRPDMLSFLTTGEINQMRAWQQEISIVPEAALLRDLVLYMHDPTEGGLRGGLEELSRLSRRAINLDPSRVTLADLTRRAAAELCFDPLCLISSGVLLAVLPPAKVEIAQQRLADNRIPSAIIGSMGDKVSERKEGQENDGLTFPSKEELWRLLAWPAQ